MTNAPLWRSVFDARILGTFDPNAPASSIEVGVLNDPVQVQADKDGYGERHVLATFYSGTGSLIDSKPPPELSLREIQVAANIGNLLKFHAGSLSDLPAKITCQNY